MNYSNSISLQSIEAFKKRTLIDLVYKCTNSQQDQFRRIFSHKNQNAFIEDIVENMDYTKMVSAILLCERTIDKNNKS